MIGRATVGAAGPQGRQKLQPLFIYDVHSTLHSDLKPITERYQIEWSNR